MRPQKLYTNHWTHLLNLIYTCRSYCTHWDKFLSIFRSPVHLWIRIPMREGFLKHEPHEVQTVLFPDWCHCSTALILQPWYGEALQRCSETEIALKEHLICCYFSINISIFLTLSFTFRAGPQTQTHGSVSPSIQPEGLKWLFGALIQT